MDVKIELYSFYLNEEHMLRFDENRKSVLKHACKFVDYVKSNAIKFMTGQKSYNSLVFVDH